ncbi:helix-turn-helix domain-containing protein [Mycolicibacterium elephantis]|uniref:helix-turn-helix domain-containing protein n=1 Tax=Mycolicibacterium elephantis TaxID=81858 RepID=UPI0009ED8DCE|nr:helix-turn-helix transcriptional regulator [Mycolicibacterium elephantis]MCV7220102.1 helix-turn-helix transcriptional regulator [Mycolicibacterium elephantis]
MPTCGLATELGLAIREARSSLGISQERLSELAGLDRTYVSGVERGTRNPTLDSMTRLASALGVRLSDLLKRAEELS